MPGPQVGSKAKYKTRRIHGMLQQICEDEGWIRLKRALNTQLDQAAAGELPSLQYISERLDGKAPQPLANDGDSVFEIVIRDLARERGQK
jgi:hypothetical protein